MPARHVAIIGAGPSGLIAAEQLAQAGHVVTLYDRMPAPARKFLLAGRGGLNLTHSEPFERFAQRYREASGWLEPMLRDFPPEALRRWALDLGQETFVGSSGRVFPKAMKASPLLRAWLRRLDAIGVRFELAHRWIGWDEQGALCFAVQNGATKTTKADATLLALGGASWPRLGSDGGWAALLAERSVAISPLRPANCGFTVDWSATMQARHAGSPLKRIIIHFDGQRAAGEAMIDAKGLEGGAVYALSAPLRVALARDGLARIMIDLRPDLDLTQLTARLARRRKGETASNHLRKAAGLAPVAVALLREVTGGDLPDDPTALAGLIKAAPLMLTGIAPIARAISSAGGIALSELDAGLMLKRLPGVFAAGEMLDWEAPTGGYLLQACFATGIAAARGIDVWLNRP